MSITLPLPVYCFIPPLFLKKPLATPIIRWRGHTLRATTGREDIESQFDRMFDAITQARTREMQEFFALGRAQEEATEFSKISQGGRRVQIQKSEKRSSNSYRYYESVTVTNGGGPWVMQRAQMTISPFSGLFTFLMILAAALYALLTYQFNRNFERSTFKKEKRMELSLMWPALLVSPEFREKFGKVINPQEKKGDPSLSDRE